jgi:hypothetical protein
MNEENRIKQYIKNLEDEKKCWESAELLGNMEAKEVKKFFPEILKLIKENKNSQIKQAAIYVLGLRGKEAKEAINIIKNIVIDSAEDIGTRESGIWALGEIMRHDNKDYIELCIGIMKKDREPKIKLSMMKILEEISLSESQGDKVFIAFKKMLNEKDESVRETASKTIKDYKKRQRWQRCISSKCWCCTGYSDDWGPAIENDKEIQQIIEMEEKLVKVPEWAEKIVKRSIEFLPMCGHYLFPKPYMEAIKAIGSETPPDIVYGCWTVDRDRKEQMSDYVFCFDAWLAGAKAEDAANELNALGYRHIDWSTVCKDLWNVLGVHTEVKDLLVERLIHSQRRKIKGCIWDDDIASEFGRDQYLGNYSVGKMPDCYINRKIPLFLFGTTDRSSPKIQRLEGRLSEICSDWKWFGYTIEFGWLCSPKAFRFLERLIWAIGKERKIHTGDHPMEDSDKVSGFLKCGDLIPNKEEAKKWTDSFSKILKSWWQGKVEKGEMADEVNKLLGKATPVKQWLVRLLLKKIDMLRGDKRYMGTHH